MKPSPRDIEHRLKQLDESDTDPALLDDLTVEWGDADPEARPEGVAFDADSDTLRFDLWSAQREALDSVEREDYDITAFMAGYGAGKTVLGARWLLSEALTHDSSRFLAMGQSFSEAKGTTFKALFSQLPGDRTSVVTAGFNGPENSPVVRDYNRTEHRLVLANDTEIILGSADKWSRYAGLEVGGIWLDEPAHYGDELFDLLEMLGGRLRGVPGSKAQLWTLTGAGYNAAFEILELREDKNGEPIRLDIDVIRASTLDNPYLTEGDIDRFRRQYAGTAREEQALYGGFSAGTGLVYPQFDPEVHVVEHDTARDLVDRDSHDWIYGYDAGWTDARVVLEAVKIDGDRLVVLDEFYRHESHVTDAIEWLSAHDKPTGLIYAEHEPSDIERFNQAGWRAEQADKSLDAGIAEVRRWLKPDPETESVGLLVSERCENLINEFRGYKEEHVGTTQATDHALDSLRYLCMGASAPKKEPGAVFLDLGSVKEEVGIGERKQPRFGPIHPNKR